MKKSDFVRGKTIEQILNTPLKELEKLTESELRWLVGRGVSSANKRLRRFQAKTGHLPYVGKNTPFGKVDKDKSVIEHLKGFNPQKLTTGAKGVTYEEMKFSTVGKDRAGLMEEFKRIKSFMGAKTSSLRGYSKVQKNVIKGLQTRGIDLTQTNYNKFFEAYSKLKELNPAIDDRNFRYQIMREMEMRVEGKKRFSVNKLVNDMKASIDNIYEENERVKNGDGTSGFFEV